MTHTLIGYARCSTDKQDLASQKEALLKLGVAADRIYTDHGFTGTTRERPGLDQALAAVRNGDTLVVPKLDRLARSVPDARAIGDELTARSVRLQIGTSVHDPSDPMGKLFFNILATFAEFESDLIRLRTREGMAIARAKGKLRGKKPKLSDRQQKELRRMHDSGEYSISDLAEVFSISRPTVYRTLARQSIGVSTRSVIWPKCFPYQDQRSIEHLRANQLELLRHERTWRGTRQRCLVEADALWLADRRK
nr:recombinase family protein [Pseudomonas amygdali]